MKRTPWSLMSIWLQARSLLAVIAATMLTIDARAQTDSALTIDLDSALHEDIAAASAAFGIEGALTLSDDHSLEADPDDGVSIGRVPLQHMLQEVHPDSQRMSVRFLVAHEIWHQVQFKKLGSNILLGDRESRRLYECQADLMGAHFAASQIRPLTQTDRNAFAGVWKLAHDIGVQRFSLADHPSQEQRRTSVKFGFLRAIYEVSPVMFPTEVWKNRQIASSSVLDLHDEEPVFDWSLRICKEIVRYRNAAVASVSVVGPIVNFDTDADHAFFTFQLPYHNLGDRAVKVSIQIQSSSVRRLHPNVRTTVLNQTFELQPDATFTVNGILPFYGVRSSGEVPDLVYSLDDERTLISAEFIPTAPVQASPDNLSPSASALALAIERLANDAVTGFQNSRASGGTQFDDWVNYRSSVEIPGAHRTDIMVESDGATSVWATLYRGGSQSDAQAIYEKTVADIKSAWPMKQAKESTWRRTGLPKMELQVTKNADLEVYIFQSEHSVEYSVTLTLTPRRF